MARDSAFPSMTALLGLLAIAGYQNRDKISEMLGNLTKGSTNQGDASQGASPGTGAALPGGLGGLLAGTSVGGLLNGGLGELMDKFNQAGQKDKVDSWVGTGPNKDVAPTDLKTALGPDVLNSLSRATGLSEQELLDRLSRTLPQAVDQYTPQGRIA
ncbi:YidB family protein [Pseudorhodoplanes sp.]|uniref:YidB family protein n=1 Tax=Pseudorhodoplanes sp. TaxID=1934341 RepID=UPI003D0BC89B